MSSRHQRQFQKPADIRGIPTTRRDRIATAGEMGPILDKVSIPVLMTMSGFIAIACYNSI